MGPGYAGAAAMSRFRVLGKVLAYLGVGLLGLGCCVLLPCTQKVLDGEGWVYSQNRVKQIGLGLLGYHEVYGKLPPAVVTDKAGRPLYSWRVLLLPFMEQQDLYKQFRLDEPWDSPHNQQFLKADAAAACYSPYGLGGDPPGTTRYQVFVGPGTAFELPGLTFKDIADGPENTILVVEAGRAVPWSKPEDLAYDPGGPLPPLGGLFGKPVHFLCYEVGRRPGFNACFADGSARFIPSDNDEQTLRALITRNGSEQVDPSMLE
jgi:hypothetical protein